VTASNSLEGRRKRLFDAVGKFLFEHRLEPSPTNYMLVHMLVTGSNASAVAAIEEATGDGLRLSQEDADRIVTMVGADDLYKSPAFSDAMVDEARRQMEDFATLVDETRADVETYERDLQTGAAGLALANDPESVADLIRITSAMIERTRAAEERLETATDEARTLREQLASAEEEARRDALTGLPNRRAFTDRYDELMETGASFAVALCDIDRFKRINDSHGHAVGDRVLRTVARILEKSCDGAMVARYGGEEFIIVFPWTDAAAASRIIDAARDAVAARNFRVRETDAPVGQITLSAGVVAAAAGESVDALLSRVDTLLYRAKNDGRNRVEAEAVGDA
jgi:diguanylate cyclase